MSAGRTLDRAVAPARYLRPFEEYARRHRAFSLSKSVRGSAVEVYDCPRCGQQMVIGPLRPRVRNRPAGVTGRCDCPGCAYSFWLGTLGVPCWLPRHWRKKGKGNRYNATRLARRTVRDRKAVMRQYHLLRLTQGDGNAGHAQHYRPGT